MTLHRLRIVSVLAAALITGGNGASAQPPAKPVPSTSSKPTAPPPVITPPKITPWPVRPNTPPAFTPPKSTPPRPANPAPQAPPTTTVRPAPPTAAQQAAIDRLKGGTKPGTPAAKPTPPTAAQQAAIDRLKGGTKPGTPAAKPTPPTAAQQAAIDRLKGGTKPGTPAAKPTPPTAAQQAAIDRLKGGTKPGTPAAKPTPPTAAQQAAIDRLKGGTKPGTPAAKPSKQDEAKQRAQQSADRVGKLPPNKKADLLNAQKAAEKARDLAKKPQNTPTTRPKPDKVVVKPDPKGLSKSDVKPSDGKAHTLQDVLKARLRAAEDRKAQMSRSLGFNLSDSAISTLKKLEDDPSRTAGEKLALEHAMNGRPLTQPERTLLNNLASEPGQDLATRVALTQLARDVQDQDRERRNQQSLLGALANLGGGGGGGSGGLGGNGLLVGPLSGGVVLPSGPDQLGPAVPTVFIPSDPSATLPGPGDLYPTVPGVAIGVVPSPPPAALVDPKDGGTPSELVVSLGEAAQDTAVDQDTRYLRLANGTAEPLTFHIQYETVEDGKGAWLPGEPGGEKELTLTVEAGETADVTDNGWRVNARSVRIWCEGKSAKYVQFKDKNLPLVPEVDKDGKQTYQADSIDVFCFTVR